MFLPDKHISFAESLLGLGHFILENIEIPITIDNLWHTFEQVQGNEYPTYHSFDNLVLAVDALYAVGMLKLDEDGQIRRDKVGP